MLGVLESKQEVTKVVSLDKQWNFYQLYLVPSPLILCRGWKGFVRSLMGRIKQKSAFDYVQKIQIILRMRKFHQGLYSLFIHSIVSSESVSGQWKPWLDCADAQADLGLRCPHMPKNTFYHGAANIVKPIKCSYRRHNLETGDGLGHFSLAMTHPETKRSNCSSALFLRFVSLRTPRLWTVSPGKCLLACAIQLLIYRAFGTISCHNGNIVACFITSELVKELPNFRHLNRVKH